MLTELLSDTVKEKKPELYRKRTRFIDLPSLKKNNSSLSNNDFEADYKSNPDKASKGYFTKLREFFRQPRIVCIYDTGCYIIFLLMYSYFLLCDFTYTTSMPIDYIDNASLSLNQSETVMTNEISNPSTIEYLLLLWIISFILEEFRQFFTNDRDYALKKNVKIYFRDEWNCNYVIKSNC
jgi:hypothetical protein